MKVNVASNLKCNLKTTKTKNIQFKPDLVDLDLNINLHKKSKIDKNAKTMPSCIKLDNMYKQNIDIKTFNSLMKFNTHVNRISIYKHNKVNDTRRRVQFDYDIVNSKWSEYYKTHIINTIECSDD